MSIDPHNPLHLELAVIATTILDPDQMRLPEVRALKPEHLRHLPGVWAIMREITDAGGAVELYTLAQHMQDPRWPRTVTINELAGMAAYSIRPQELPGAVLGILNAHRCMMAGAASAELSRSLSEPDTDHASAISAAHASLTNLLGTSIQDNTEAVSEDLTDALHRLMNPRHHRGPTSGLPSLDKILGGWQPRTLNVIAARPSMGKSALVGQLAQAAAFGGPTPPARVLMFSLEDGKTVTRMRTLTRLSGVEMRHDTDPPADAEYRLGQAREKLERLNQMWMIDEESRLEAIISACWRQHAIAPLGLVIIDQLSHIVAEGTRGRADNRTQLYGYITKELKRQVAQRLGTPVILVSQLSREITKRSEPVPELTDLRDSGEIEQDADTVTFIHRPDYYDPNDQPGQAQLLVRKNRNGPTKTAMVRCNMRTFKFWEGAM